MGTLPTCAGRGQRYCRSYPLSVLLRIHLPASLQPPCSLGPWPSVCRSLRKRLWLLFPASPSGLHHVPWRPAPAPHCTPAPEPFHRVVALRVPPDVREPRRLLGACLPGVATPVPGMMSPLRSRRTRPAERSSAGVDHSHPVPVTLIAGVCLG